MDPVTDDEVQSGAAIFADEPEASTGIQGTPGSDPRVGSTHPGWKVQVDLRAARVPGEDRRSLLDLVGGNVFLLLLLHVILLS